MTTFDSREKAYEGKFAHDQELEFKIVTRAKRRLAYWAAEQMGLDEDARETYAEEVLKASITQNPSAVDKIVADFGGKSIGLGKTEVLRQREKCYQEARKHFMEE